MEERGTVFVESKGVAEVKFGDIQKSSLHKVGYAPGFPYTKRIRWDLRRDRFDKNGWGEEIVERISFSRCFSSRVLVSLTSLILLPSLQVKGRAQKKVGDVVLLRPD